MQSKNIEIKELQYSFLDLFYVLKELKSEGIFGAKIEKVYQPKPDEILLQLFYINKNNEKKKTFLSLNPFIIFLKQEKAPTDRPPHFCEYLRKKITNFRIKDITQIESDRVVLLELEGKEETKEKYFIIVEMFGKGNIIFAEKIDNRFIIQNQLRTQKTKERTIKPNQEYVPPTKEFDFLYEIKKEDTDIIKNFKTISKKDASKDVVHFIASDLNFGGKYSDEICLIAGVEKSKKLSDLKKEEWEKLIDSLKKITNKKINPIVYKKNKEIISITPFETRHNQQKNKDIISENFEGRFFELIQKVESMKIKKEIKSKINSKFEGKKKKLETVIKVQKKQLENNKKDSEKYHQMGEKIYENYQEVEEFLKEINTIREKKGWKEINRLVKDKYFEIKFDNKIKIIKMDEKTGRIIIDL